MPSADFCTGVRKPHGPLSLVAETRRRPPEVSSTAFTAHPPDLQPQALDGYGLRDQLSARPTWAASYPVSVRQVAASLRASFRPRLAATPLRFARTSPPSGCAGDLHPQAVEHARHTTKPLRGGEDRDLGMGSASATRPTGLDFARRLSQRAAPGSPPAGRRRMAAAVCSLTPPRAGTPPRLRPLPIDSISIEPRPCPSRLRPPRLYPQGRRGPG
jgi:hypothetical protein